MRPMLCALALLLGLGMAAAPARAQDQDRHAAMMAEHHRELGLTPAQAERMAAIHASAAAAMRTHCAQVRAAGGPNAQTHAAMHGQMTEAMESAHRQAMAVLTAPQRAKLDSLHAAHHGGAGHDMAAMHARHDGAATHAAHDSAGMAKMHAEMHGGGAMCSANGADCCAAPASTEAARPRG
jgi:hypothetical protein